VCVGDTSCCSLQGVGLTVAVAEGMTEGQSGWLQMQMCRCDHRFMYCYYSLIRRTQALASNVSPFFSTRVQGATGQRRTVALAAVITSVTGLAAMGALLLAQTQVAPWGR